MQNFSRSGSIILLILTAVGISGQFYGKSLPCPTSYLDPDGDCVPGIAGKDYPMYKSFPKTQFKCSDHPVKLLGYFADQQSNCQVFHVCLHDGRQESFMCPNGTIFNQQFLVCDWWFNVKCPDAPKLYQINDYLQVPVAFRRGPIHPNNIPIASDKNHQPVKKQFGNSFPNSVSNPSMPITVSANIRAGSVEKVQMNPQTQDFDWSAIMPRNPVGGVADMETNAPTTAAPVTPASEDWAKFGLQEIMKKEGVESKKNNAFLVGSPRMV